MRELNASADRAGRFLFGNPAFLSAAANFFTSSGRLRAEGLTEAARLRGAGGLPGVAQGLKGVDEGGIFGPSQETSADRRE